MSFESTLTYYQIINEEVNKKLNGLHSAKILLYSVDFADIEKLQALGDWDACGQQLSEVAVRLEKAGAELMAICTNTMHKVAKNVQANISIPLIHIAEATAYEIKKQNLHTVALLGTKYTMQQDFYKEKLIEHDINVLIPSEQDIQFVNDIIYNQLCLGKINDSSKHTYQQIINKLHANGAQGVILGCTEIGLLITQDDVDLPIFDTTIIHAKAIANYALQSL